MDVDRSRATLGCDLLRREHQAATGEKEILISAGVCMYILRGALNGDQMRDALVKALPTICRRHRQLAPPVICHISRDGVVTVMHGKRRGSIKRS